jgi:hypothetical protein
MSKNMNTIKLTRLKLEEENKILKLNIKELSEEKRKNSQDLEAYRAEIHNIKDRINIFEK